jgi:hypothetical protein
VGGPLPHERQLQRRSWARASRGRVVGDTQRDQAPTRRAEPNQNPPSGR